MKRIDNMLSRAGRFMSAAKLQAQNLAQAGRRKFNFAKVQPEVVMFKYVLSGLPLIGGEVYFLQHLTEPVAAFSWPWCFVVSNLIGLIWCFYEAFDLKIEAKRQPNNIWSRIYAA